MAMHMAATGRILRILSPQFGEGYESGSIIPINWLTFGGAWNTNDTLLLEYTDNGGNSWQDIPGATNLIHTTNLVNWDSTGLSLSTQYLIRLTYTADASVIVSSETFAVAGPLDHFDVYISPTQAQSRIVWAPATITAMDANSTRLNTFSSFATNGRFPVSISAPGITVSGLEGSGNELVASNFTYGIANLNALGMQLTADATPTTVQFIVTSANAKTGVSSDVTIYTPPDYFTQEFDLEAFDLENHSLTFIPNKTTDGYNAYCSSITELPTDPTNSTALNLSDDDFKQITLTNVTIQLYGENYTVLYVGSNGYITFGQGDTEYSQSLTTHFNIPRISPMFADFYPGEEDISYKELADRVVITYDTIPNYGISNSSTFQVELFEDGRIVLSYLNVDTSEMIVGLSRGNGIPFDFMESDFSTYPDMPDRMLFLTQPVGGEAYICGMTVDVSWVNVGNGWTNGETIHIDYSTNSGNAWLSLPGAENVAYSDQSYLWNTTGFPTDHYYRIRLVSDTDPGVEDASFTDFAIIPNRIITLTYPTGGSVLEVGSTATVTWTTSGSSWQGGDTITIQYSIDNGETWNTISGAETLLYSNGTFEWDLNGLTATDIYWLRIFWAEEAFVNDTIESPFVLGTRYYVNDASTNLDAWCTTTGNAANSGISPASPKSDIQDIIDTYDLGPGDTIYIDTGNYILSSAITIESNDAGSAIAPVTFAGSPYGTILDRGEVDNAWSLSEAPYLTIKTGESTLYPDATQHMMRVTSAGADGFEIESSSYCTIENIQIYSNATAGISMYLSHNIILNNNDVRGNGDGLYWEECNNVLATSNTVSENDFYGMASWFSRAATMQNNLIVSNEYIGISLWYGSCDIYQNTLVGNDSSQIEIDDISINMLNNILTTDQAGDPLLSLYIYSEVDSLIADYNLYYTENNAYICDIFPSDPIYTLPEWQAMFGQDAHSIALNPLFVNPANDYHLQSTAGSYHDGVWTSDPLNSPAIDSGYGDAGNEPTPNTSAGYEANRGTRNLGAYGGTDQASKTPTGRVVVLTTPIGGESYLDTAQPTPIQWYWIGSGWSNTDTLALSFSTNSGTTWNNVTEAQSLPTTNTTTTWDISDENGLHYKVRLTCNQDTNYYDESLNDFRIGGPFTWYVNDNFTNNDEWCIAIGNDSNDGTSPDQPKASVQAILDQYNLEPDDSVYIDTGIYSNLANVRVESKHSGTADAPITFEFSPYGVEFIRSIDGGTTKRNWEFIDSDYCILRTAEGTRYPELGTTWAQLTEANTGGIYINADNCVIERLTIAEGYGTAIDIFGTNTTIRNCIFRNNRGTGIELSGYYTSYSDGTTIENNTFVADHNYAIETETVTRNIIIRNNIICVNNTNDYGIYWDDTLVPPTSDFNLFYITNDGNAGYFGGNRITLADWQTASGQDANSLSANPLFVTTDGTDAHLQSKASTYDETAGTWIVKTNNSPAIDTGNPNSAYDNEPYWSGDGINIGAYGNTAFASKSHDQDGDTLSDTFELFILGTLADESDSDNDSMSDNDELFAGTDPTNSDSAFTFANATTIIGTNIVIQWQSASNRVYHLDHCSDIMNPTFISIASNILATPPVNVYTTQVDTTHSSIYRVSVSMP